MSSIVNHKVYGEDNSKAIYILHGVFGMLDNWHYTAKHLSEKYRVITFDARNHGKSFHDSDCSYNAMAGDLKALMDYHKDESAIVLGHSMGGKTSLIFSDLYPNSLNQLIVIDIAPKAYPAGHLEFIKAFQSIDFTKINNRKEADEAFTPFAPIAPIRQFLLKNIESRSEGGYQLKININALAKQYPAIIGGINLTGKYHGRIDFIKGEKSGYIKEEDQVKLSQLFNEVHFHNVPKAGHWVHADNPEYFLNLLSSILP